MLCVDDKKRITMDEIIKHSWLVHTDNWECIIEETGTKIDNVNIDDSILAQMEFYGFTKETVIRSLQNKSYNPATATFNLLQLRKDKAKSSNHESHRRIRRVDSFNPAYLRGIASTPTSVSTSPQNCSPGSKSPRTISPTFYAMLTPLTHIPNIQTQQSSPNRPTLTRVKSQTTNRQRSATANEILRKRKRSASDKDPEIIHKNVTEISPLLLNPSKPRYEKSGLRFQTSPRKDEQQGESQTNESQKTELENDNNTITKQQTGIPSQIPSSKVIEAKPVLRKTVSEFFGEKEDNEVDKDEIILRNSPQLHRVAKGLRNTNSGIPTDINDSGNAKLSSRVFTLTKQIISQSKKTAEKEKNSDEPRALRTPFSVTSTKNPKEILAQIENYFKVVNIPYEPVNKFVLKGLHSDFKVRFEIEVCRVPNLQNLYSIRMQRVDGEWEKYKQFSEELISHLDL